MAIEIYKNALRDSNYRECIYSTASPDKYRNIVPGTVKSEINRAGSFEFDVYNGVIREINAWGSESETGQIFIPYWDYISVEDTKYNVYTNERYIFYGRVASIEVDLNGKWHVTCEGLMADLLDFPVYNSTSYPQPQPQHEGSDYDTIYEINENNTATLFNTALLAWRRGTGREDIQTGSVWDDLQISAQEDDDTENHEFVFDNPFGSSCGDFINTNLVSKYGGVLRMDYRWDSRSDIDGICGTLHWAPDPTLHNSSYLRTNQNIEYGFNVLSGSLSYERTDRPNGIFAVGSQKKDGKSTGGHIWEQDSLETHVTIPHVTWGEGRLANESSVVKTVYFDLATSIGKLRKMAQRYVDAYCKRDNYKITATVLDLHYVGYDPGSDESTIGGDDYDPIRPLHKYRVKIPFVYKNIDEDMFCLSSELDIANLSNSSYTFGWYETPETVQSYYITRLG